MSYALFLGVSMSITAFPVLARILTDRTLNRSRLGALALSCAAIDDVTAWCLLAVVVAVSTGTGISSVAVTVGLSAAFFALMFFAVRPIMASMIEHLENRRELRGMVLTLVFAGLMLSAVGTDRIGIHSIFGAFLFGMVMPRRSTLVSNLPASLEPFLSAFLLPVFFAYSGMRTQLGNLGADLTLWLICGVIVLVAILGKWGGTTLAARLIGLDWREANGLGILMNCRGLTELVILNIGLDLGVISPTLFTMLVIMALVTTFMTTPALVALFPSSRADAPLPGGTEKMVAGDDETEAVVTMSETGVSRSGPSRDPGT